MPDPSYNGKVYIKQGAEEMVIEDGGQITVESGGDIEIDGDSVAAAAAIIAALPTENVASPGIWNDNGVLKLGTAT